MFIIYLLFFYLFSVINCYNILTIDGGGIRGIIPATCIVHMEMYAYHYAKVIKNYDIPLYKNETTNQMI